MRLVKPALLAALAACVVFRAVPCQEDHAHQHGSPESLGTVHFQVSCGPEAQRQFDRAVALLHSFWYDPESARQELRVAKTFLDGPPAAP